MSAAWRGERAGVRREQKIRIATCTWQTTVASGTRAEWGAGTM